MPLPKKWDKLDLVSLDFESYWGVDYTLRKLPTSDYVRDKRFKAHMVGVKINDGPTELVLHKDIAKRLKKINWKRSMLLCHNTLFDGLIISHHYGFVPAVYLDTLAMARGLHSNEVRAGLDDVARFYGVGNKMPDVLTRSKDILNLEEHPDLLLDMGAYCVVDVDIMYLIFQRMLPKIPADELELIDLTTRCFCDPVLEIDTKLAAKVHADELARRKALFGKVTGQVIETDADYEVARKALKKDVTFADLILECGYEPPMKWSEKQEKEIYAFSKPDLTMFIESIEAQGWEVPDELEAAVEARIAANSSITLTRAQRFMDLRKEIHWKAPIGYRYYAAHTGRWGGTDKRNFQNLGRGSELRKAIMAAHGWVVGVADSSQIEARVLAWLAGAEWKLQAFRDYDVILGAVDKATGREIKLRKGADPVAFAYKYGDEDKYVLLRGGPDTYRLAYHRMFNIPLDEVTKDLRQIGKVGELALGYQGADGAFVSMAKNYKVKLPAREVTRAVKAWRKANPEIVKFWAECENVLALLYLKRSGTFGPGGILRYGWEDGIPGIWFPNGMRLKYPKLTCDYDPKRDKLTNFSFMTNFGPKKIYGGLVCENITQGIARIAVAEQLLTVQNEQKRRVVLMTHDEGGFTLPRVGADKAMVDILQVFNTPPRWAPELPVSGAGGHDRRYSK